MSDYSSKQYIPITLVIITFAVYLSTICPTVYLGDSGELTVAAFSLGIPHPSGYPLYALLGKLFCLIPVGNIGFRMNLMSVFFSLATVWVVYSIIYKITSSIASSIAGAFSLAFTPLFWGQTISAEVYPLHTFFVALIIRLLIYWEDNRDLCRLALVSFIVGLSFLNHLQTVMMAPSVLFFFIISDRKNILNIKTIAVISILFLFALTIYFYLPIRTHAGAAIHWGDPDSLKTFWDVVSGKAHRSGYVFNKTYGNYIVRSHEALRIVLAQFGVISLFALWGFIKLLSLRWKIFYSGIIVFDFFYTIFLNTVNIEVTTFNLPTLIVIAILIGIGISDLLNRYRLIAIKSKIKIYQISNIACCAVPVIFMASNFNICDQSRNYTAYEHALNVFRTVNYDGTMFIDGDNNLFPIIYARIVEQMRKDVMVFDQYDLFFKVQYMGDKTPFVYYGERDDLFDFLKKIIIEKKMPYGVYFSSFNPDDILMPEDYKLIRYGILSQITNNQMDINQKKQVSVWNYYLTVSLEDNFTRDFMNREVTAYYHLNKGRHLLMLGGIKAGLKRLKLAAQVGYDDDLIHTELSSLYVDYGFFKEARMELEKSLIYCQDLAGVYNNWGYYYSKRGDFNNAINYISKAVEKDPSNITYCNNLGFIFLNAGREKSAIEAFKKSLSINGKQENIKKILKENDVNSIKGE